MVSPMLVSISGSHSTEYISPMTGSTVLNGNRTSSTLLLIHPEIVTIRLTLLLLCNGRYSKVFTAPVLLCEAFMPIDPPIPTGASSNEGRCPSTSQSRACASDTNRSESSCKTGSNDRCECTSGKPYDQDCLLLWRDPSSGTCVEVLASV